MKLIALCPIRNENWIIKFYIEKMLQVADLIVFRMHSENDAYIYQYVSDKVHIIEPYIEDEPESNWRQRLLDYGRQLNGTHFIFLDADEIFSDNFTDSKKQVFEQMNKGDHLSFNWIALWKSTQKFRNDDSVWSNNWKNFVFCDDKISNFQPEYRHASRTPFNENPIRRAPDVFSVLHFQFVNWENFQLKQAWYRCFELIRKLNNIREINSRYSISLDDPSARLADLPNEWLDQQSLPDTVINTKISWHLNEIFDYFNNFGIEYFEYLDIWHIPILKREFENRMGRLPLSGYRHLKKKLMYYLLKKRRFT